MVWALDAGLWNLRQDATDFFASNPGENNNAAKSAIVKGLYITWIKSRTNRTWIYMGAGRRIYI